MNRRINQRIDLNNPLVVQTKIHKFYNKQVPHHITWVNIENISLNGLCFSSDLNFPVNKNMVLSFKVRLFNFQTTILGTIVWKRKTIDGYTYGLEILSSNIGYIQTVAFFTGKS
jgi:hypothetical protein